MKLCSPHCVGIPNFTTHLGIIWMYVCDFGHYWLVHLNFTVVSDACDSHSDVAGAGNSAGTVF